MQRRSGLTLWSINDVDLGRVPVSYAPALREITEWTRSFLLAEHPMLGREGPVCPYTKIAIENNLFLLACPQVQDGDVQTIVLRFRDWYRALAATMPERTRIFLTFLIVLPHIDREDPSGLDDLQADVKSDFVEDGLMIGQFHPKCDRPGIWNKEFRPLRSPVPLLAIRAMVRQDLPFLELPEHREAYERYFGERIAHSA